VRRASLVALVLVVAEYGTGAGFTSTGDRTDSLAMSVLTGVALLCYAANIYVVRPPGPRG
jgi:hypothetical protein